MKTNLINLTQTKEAAALVWADAYLEAAINGESNIVLDTKTNAIEALSYQPSGPRYVILDEIQGNCINADSSTDRYDLAQAFLAGDFEMSDSFQDEDEQQEWILYYADEVNQ